MSCPHCSACRLESAIEEIRVEQAAFAHRILERLHAMSTVADNTAAAVAAENTKVDALIAAIGPGLQALRDQLAAAQAQIASLQAGDAADATTLTATIAAAQDEAAKVQAAIDVLTPPVTP
jgi:septal ring factor EnvC (AmiA/AmiB activator)